MAINRYSWTRRDQPWTRRDLLAVPGLALIIIALVIQFTGGTDSLSEIVLGIGILLNTLYLFVVRGRNRVR